MSDYSAVMKDLENAIHRNHMLEQAQQPDSAHAERYQSRVRELTDALVELEQAVPGLAELDRRIAAAEADLHEAFRGAELRPQVWPQLGTWTGVLGLVGLLAGVGLGLAWQVVAFSVMLLLGAAGCVTMMVRQRQDAGSDLQHAQEVLADLEEERRLALPSVPAELIGGVA